MEWSDLNAKKGGRKPYNRKGGQPEFRMPSLQNLPSHLILFVLAGLLLIWLATGIYIVDPDEVGVVQRFGKVTEVKEPGPHYHFPRPIEKVQLPKIKEIKRLEIGFRTVAPGPPARYRQVDPEALMLTGDENIVNINFIVQYQIQDPQPYLFNIRDQGKTIRDAAESALREVIGKNKIEDILTVGKYRIQQETQELLQIILDLYQSGLKVTTVELQDVHPPDEVMDAFKDVASAKEDKNKVINEAYGYRNDELPKARGQAARIVAEAEASRDEIMRYAEGDTSRFLQNYAEYKKAKEITRKRLYIEAMEKILPKVQKYVLEEPGQGLIEVLPLGQGLPAGLKEKIKDLTNIK